MNDEQRSQVLDNAKYLREVRPIDPEEIHEYVEGQPHPAAVRQVLRENAFALGLLERSDGRFEPTTDEPLTVAFDGVDELPESLSHTLEGMLIEKFGPGWPDGTSGERLRATIRDFKSRYLRGDAVTYDDITALGYAIYHFPSYYAASQYVFADLIEDGLLTDRLRVLDVGAGVGGPALGLDTLLGPETLVDYHGVEPSEAASVLERMLEETGKNVHSTIHREPIETVDLEGEFDLIICANVLSELGEPGAVLHSLLEHLAPDGTMCALSPADRNTAIALRELERTVEREAGVTIYAPTVRLWPDLTPESESWSFDRKPDLDVPGFQRKLDEGDRSVDSQAKADQAGQIDQEKRRPPGDGEFVNVDVQYAYSILRRDGKRSIEFTPRSGRVAKMAETEKHVTDRIDLYGIKLSHDLSDGENPLYLVGDGSQQIDHFAVLPRQSALNRALETADYGDLLQFENVLVLWNDDEGAYNLVVDGETIVERIPT